MITRCALLFSVAAVAAADPTPNAVLTPWCENSFRVRISPDGLPSEQPPAAQAAAAALQRSLKAKNMTDLTGALTDATCKPGAAVGLSTGAGDGRINGNLKVSNAPDGSLVFERRDTKQVLFSAKASFTYVGYVQGSLQLQ